MPIGLLIIVSFNIQTDTQQSAYKYEQTIASYYRR